MAKISGEGATKKVVALPYGEGKRCPFLNTNPLGTAICIENECMLWNEEKQTCNINVIAGKK